jgi:hypothetical protein
MAVTINSSSTPTLAQLKSDLLIIAQLLSRKAIPMNNINSGTITHLKSIGADAGDTLTVADA